MKTMQYASTPTKESSLVAAEANMNPRTKRARDRLINAAFDLVPTRPVNDISLTEIAQTAKVSRPTVYKLFNDTASLVAVATIESLDEVLASIDSEMNFQDGSDYLHGLMRKFVHAVYEHKDYYRHAIYGPSAAQIMTGVSKMLDNRMRTRLIGDRLAPSGLEADDCRATISAGVVWLLIRWLDSDFKGENAPDGIADRIANTMLRLSSSI